MLGIGFAVLSAFGFGVGQVLTQLGFRSGTITALQALFLNLAAACAGLALALALGWGLSPLPLRWSGVAVFALAGMMAPLAGRSINFLAIERIGATRTASLGMSESLFAGVIAYVALDQTVSPITGAGMVILIAGTVLFVNEIGRTLGQALPRFDRREPLTRIGAGTALALTSGLFYAAAGVLRQVGMNLLPSALLGATVGSLVALVVTAVNLVRRRQAQGLRRLQGKVVLCLAGSGIAASTGMVAFFLALQFDATVAVATALKNTMPLFTFLLAGVVLARWERISFRLGLLVGLVVAGGVLTALGRL
ncbi:MAG: EamA family transporter [Thermoleophilia bacterium]|nr:EamA family transporter [Thermoleophilia bacterium]